MITLSPIIEFQTAHKDAAEQLAINVRSRWMSVALTHAMSSMAYGKCTPEQLEGARLFIGVFLNLAEPVEKLPPQPPSKELGEPLPKPDKT